MELNRNVYKTFVYGSNNILFSFDFESGRILVPYQRVLDAVSDPLPSCDDRRRENGDEGVCVSTDGEECRDGGRTELRDVRTTQMSEGGPEGGWTGGDGVQEWPSEKDLLCEGTGVGFRSSRGLRDGLFHVGELDWEYHRVRDRRILPKSEVSKDRGELCSPPLLILPEVR